MPKRDLMFAHLGAGITVCDRNVMEHGDYKVVAHIRIDRTVNYLVKRLSAEDRAEIERFAAEEDPTISATQSQKVFYAPRW